MTVHSRSRRPPPEGAPPRRHWLDEPHAAPDGAHPRPDDPWEPAPQRDNAARLLLVPLAVGAAVAITLGVYGNTHSPTGVAVNLAGFSGPLEAKVWLTTAAFSFGLVQLISALVMYGKLSARPPEWIGGLHRWSGRIAFLLVVPVAVHCLYAAGFQDFSTRVFVHSLLGCLFFGAFVVKLLGLRKDGLPGWVFAIAGGVVFTLLVGLWWTSSLWFFTTFGVRF